ncbi:MAG: AEC family transporter [Anaerolineae bacterium]|nr:AEC family transporter [Anaerolineae bacterium]
MTELVNVLLPIFAVVAAGALLRRTGFVPAGFFHQTNRLVYWVAIPCYLFYKTAEATIEGAAAVRVFLVILAGMLGTLVLGYGVAWLRKLPRRATGAFVQGAYRGNLAYVGLPVVLLAFSSSNGRFDQDVPSLAVLAIALMIPIYNLAAVLVLVAGQEADGRRWGTRLQQLGWRLATNPLLLSCVAGLIVLAAGWQLPTPIRRTCETIGDMTTPLALMGIGSALTFRHLRDRWQDAGLVALLKLAASPLIGLLAATRLGLSLAELRMALIFLATPTATASYVMAQQLGSDDALTADIVVLTTALALPALAVVLILT